jgi:SAM-dependent methyltransferase
VNWKLKCLALHVLAHTPGSAGLYRWLQRKVTGRYLDELSTDFLAAYNYHVENFRKLPTPEKSGALEFGAGRNLLTPLLLSAAGAREVFAYDIDRLATVEQINHVIRQLRAHGIPHPGQVWREIENVDSDLKRYYRINYRAPGDARHTELPTASIDFVCSTSTLEHIACTDIAAIIDECRRICSPTALLSFIVDYHDHYATADSAITRFNFYRYSRSKWSWFNPPNHFQNRMRHSDYEALFDGCGLIALERRSLIPSDSEKDLKSVRLSSEFAEYSAQDLAALNGFFLLSIAHDPIVQMSRGT